MSRKPEYDGYLAVDDELVKETFRVHEENIRLANQEITELRTKVNELENRILVLEKA